MFSGCMNQFLWENDYLQHVPLESATFDQISSVIDININRPHFHKDFIEVDDSNDSDDLDYNPDDVCDDPIQHMI
jgi:hypothetical protein